METTRRGFFGLLAAGAATVGAVAKAAPASTYDPATYTHTVSGTSWAVTDMAIEESYTVPPKWDLMVRFPSADPEVRAGDFVSFDAYGHVHRSPRVTARGIVLSAGPSSVIVRM